MTRRKSLSGDAAATKKQHEVDHVRVFAEKVRDHKELESRWAVMQESRVEYFKGKDFINVLRKNPDLQKLLGSDVQDAEEDIGNLLLRRKLILRCDRVVKTLRPGKKKLSKWPARLDVFVDQTFAGDDGFYAWTFERRRALWQTVLSFLLPVVTLACCLFPVFPHWCKLVVLYFCLSIFALIFGILIVRWLVFGFMWIVTGKSVWFFPNILAEDASFLELIKFWPPPAKDGRIPPKLTTRLAFACVAGIVVWLCVRHAPDEAARARYQRKVSNIIDEVLEWSPKLAISGRVEEENAGVVNENDLAADNASTSDENTVI